MIYSQLPIKYSECKPIARADNGRIIYAVGALEDVEYGYIGLGVISLSEIPELVEFIPVDAILKYTHYMDWKYFE